ncbi:peptide ABC transporter substrate-binding protein [Methylobacterium sp. A54F]
MRRRDWLAGGLALVVAGPRAAAEPGRLYRRGNDADPETLDPHKTSTVAEAHILRDLYEGLLTYDNLGRIIPGMAESWRLSEDRLTYAFSLRGDARWSNGDPMQAEDFAYALRRIMAPETGAKYAEVLFPIRNAGAVNRGETPASSLGVAAPDPRTVEIRLEAPTPYFLELLTHQTALPVHRPSVERFGPDFTRPGNHVSNGPYRLVDVVPNDRITLERNPHFHAAGTVTIPRVAFIPTPDLASAVRRYGAGEIDSLADLPADQMAFLRRRFGEEVVLGPALGVEYLAFDLRKPPFDDPRLRRALSLVIDREFLATVVRGETMAPAYSLCPPGLDNALPPPELPGRERLPIDNEAEALRLLAEAGYGPGGRTLAVSYRFNSTDNNRSTALAIAEMWRPLGVHTRFVYTDAKTHFAYLRDGGPFDVARMSWIADYSDPQNFLFLLSTGNDGLNAGRYSNPAFDAVMREAAETRDLAARAALLHRAEAILLDEVPVIPVMHYRSKALIAPRLHGYHANLRNAAPTRFLSLDR